MSEATATKKIWDRTAWKDAAFFLRYLRPNFRVFIPAMIALTITAVLQAIFVNYLAKMISPALEGVRGPALLEAATSNGWIVVSIAATQAFIAFFRIMLFAKASERALACLRRDTFARIIRLPMSTLNARRIGELGSRLANDVEALRDTLVVTIPMLIRHSVMLIASIVMVFYISPRLSLFMIGTLPVVMILIAIFGMKIRMLTRGAQDNLAASQVVVDESLQSILSVKAFANEPQEIRRYNTHLDQFLNSALRAAVPRASFITFIILSFSIALTLVAWYALRMVSTGELPISMLTLFGAFSVMVTMSASQLPELFTSLQRALGATERVRELLDEAIEPEESTSIERLQGNISVKGLSFAYPSRPEVTVLNDFSFSAKAGQRIALVGPSGSGKSTMVALLFRFYAPQIGSIFFDGRPAADFPLHSLRQNLALVPQEILLFGGSVKDNIAYGRQGATDAEIIAAARQANAEEFIDRLPDGYNTLVGERGTQLSGGQRQRIAIARAILADPAILILDEATSSLDAESERLVQDALDKLMENRTSIIIAHRLSTVRRCDQILVLSGGTIVERGTHEELLGKDGSLYGTLARLQLE
ncbi:MAG: ABC transporter ATP-binding protein [Verrucomicrobia bacterium]|nr:ABC transporter ATP-binding protein [Verrucomicrobiota bacterium]